MKQNNQYNPDVTQAKLFKGNSDYFRHNSWLTRQRLNISQISTWHMFFIALLVLFWSSHDAEYRCALRSKFLRGIWINLTGEINPKQMLERQKNVAAFYSKQANGLSNRSSQTLCRWFACEPILHHRETLCVFILLGAFWAKEHITSSLCFIVFSKLINGKHSGKNRYENVYFALLKSLSTKGYQQLLWHNLWNVIRVCVWESSADKAASAITDSPLITFCFAPRNLFSLN